MAEQISKEQINDAFKLAKNFESKYWDSELPDYMNLIEDLRLSNNIHETAHSRVLYKLLCCGKCHSYPLLRTFLEIVGIEKDSNDVKLFVEKENIDLLIEIGDKVIILENKVNHAKDQDRQIEKYYNNIKKNHEEENIYVIYLTRNILDNDPNEDSLPKDLREKLKEKKHYNKISYEKEIREWISECKKGWKSELINSVLIQYGDFIKNMFEPNKKRNEVMNSIIDKIIWNVNDTEKVDVKKVDIDKKDNIINEQLEKVRNAEKSLREYKDGLEKYIINEVAYKLDNYIKKNISKEIQKNKKIQCKVDYSKAHIDFCVSYKEGLYKGVVSLYKYENFWFGLCMKDGCLVGWDEKLNNKTSIDELEKELPPNHPYTKIDKEKEYAYWKYCNDGIEKMIKEIKDYICIIKSITK